MNYKYGTKETQGKNEKKEEVSLERMKGRQKVKRMQERKTKSSSKG